MKGDDQHLELEDTLTNLTADLVVVDNVFLERLFKADAGTWLNVEQAVQGFEDYAGQVAKIQETVAGVLNVTWLDYPQSAHGNDFCLIIFWLGSLFWHNVALYNRGLFLRKHGFIEADH